MKAIEEERTVAQSRVESGLGFELSSGNVYADLGFEDPEEMAAKAGLVREIRRTMERRGLTQVQVSKLTSVDQPTLSKLLRGRTSNFSFDRLTQMLRDLGRNLVLLIEAETDRVETRLPNEKLVTNSPTFSKGHILLATATRFKFVELSGRDGVAGFGE
jgi:predicted XRE-type DNA-binding protein